MCRFLQKTARYDLHGFFHSFPRKRASGIFQLLPDPPSQGSIKNKAGKLYYKKLLDAG